jgi:hypothetical protein
VGEKGDEVKIERDEEMERDYIPLPGGWEVQTKGTGSTFRLLDKKSGERMPIPLPDRILNILERMAREIHAASPTTTLAACVKEATKLAETEFSHIDLEFLRFQQAATKACANDPGLAYPVYLLMRGYWNDAQDWADKPEQEWFDERPGNLEVPEALDAEGMATNRDAGQDGTSAPGVGEVPPESEEHS